MASGESAPIDPITELAAAAAQMHELFTAYTDAGFSHAEALQILIAIVTTAALGGGGQ
jgi:hypothetical protein